MLTDVMAEDINILGEGSPEFVAWRLTDYIFRNDQQLGKTKKQILDLYAECLYATRGRRSFSGQPEK
jgi:hypothetical protein